MNVAETWQNYAIMAQKKCAQQWNPEKPHCKALTEQIQLRSIHCQEDPNYDLICRDHDVWKKDCKLYAHYKLPFSDKSGRTKIDHMPAYAMIKQLALIESNLGHPYHFIKSGAPEITIDTSLEPEFDVFEIVERFFGIAYFHVSQNEDVKLSLIHI